MRKPLASHEDCRIFSEPIGVPERKTVLVASATPQDYSIQYILGLYSAAELTTTGVEPVSITAQGWRVIDHGPYDVDCRVPAEVRPAALPHYKVGGCYVCAHPTRPSRPSDSGIPVCDECWAAIRD